jgi:hypothetical protein
MVFFELTNEEKASLKQAMLSFCLRCFEPAANSVTGNRKKVTEGETGDSPPSVESVAKSKTYTGTHWRIR